MGNIGPRFNSPNGAFQPLNTRTSSQQAMGQESVSTGGIGSPLEGAPMNTSLPMGLAALFASEGAMTPTQMLALLRNLLQMPRELVEVLAMLSQTEGTSTQVMLQALLSENIQIPLEALQELLQSQSKQAQEKLIKLLRNTPIGFTQSSQQLGDLLQALSQISGKMGQSTSAEKGLEALHTTISLYLPYFPLQAPQQFSLQYQPGQGDEDGKDKAQDASLVVFLQTIALGALKITIEVETGTLLNIVAEHHLSTSMAKALEEQIQASLNAEHLPSTQILMVGGAKDEGTVLSNSQVVEDSHSGQQSVSILPGQGVPAVAVLAAYAVIRAVFDLDNRERS